MSNIEEKIQKDLASAMKAKNETELSALRSIKAAILNEKSNGAHHELTDDDVVKLMQKLSKQRQESADIYKSANRPELAEKELNEKEVIDRYLPKMMDENELGSAIDEIVSELGATTIKDMGKVMSSLRVAHPNRFDGGVAAKLIKSKLS